jgi:hypothetical protein
VTPAFATMIRVITTAVMAGIFAFLFGDAVGDRVVGAVGGVLAFVAVMPVVALGDARVRTS